jgi:BarA-like signal transduction histidine kinase
MSCVALMVIVRSVSPESGDIGHHEKSVLNELKKIDCFCEAVAMTDFLAFLPCASTCKRDRLKDEYKYLAPISRV